MQRDGLRLSREPQGLEINRYALAFPVAEAGRLRSGRPAELGIAGLALLLGGVARGGLFQGAAGGGGQHLPRGGVGRFAHAKGDRALAGRALVGQQESP